MKSYKINCFDDKTLDKLVEKSLVFNVTHVVLGTAFLCECEDTEDLFSHLVAGYQGNCEDQSKLMTEYDFIQLNNCKNRNNSKRKIKFRH